LLPAPRFYAGQDDLQHCFSNKLNQPCCQFVVALKLAKLRRKFASRVRPAP
jgi:hypothetical protein